MFKKNIIPLLMISFLFLTTTIFFASTVQSIIKNEKIISEPRTIYVDDDNHAGPWDGTPEHPYETITQAYNVAISGDTIFCFSGVYGIRDQRDCYMIINKSINLIGENRSNTYLFKRIGPEFYYLIVIDNVNISGFHFTVHSSCHVMTKIFVNASDHCTVTNNDFQDDFTMVGATAIIKIIDSEDIIISDNIIGRPNPPVNIIGTQGIILENSSNIQIYNNCIDEYFYGIVGKHLTKSNITNNQLYTLGGLQLVASSHNIISNNVIENGINGYGIYLLRSSDNSIIQNNFITNRIRIRKALFSDCTNTWDQNYWGRARLLPKIIFGEKTVNNKIVPAFQIDYHPARDPISL
ncbi:MAG: NosD domain-containing protein [Candidatus Thermoplasmatota archaeon]